MTLEKILAAVQFTPLLIVPVWNLYRMVSAARAGRWRRARWFARAAGTFIYLDVLVWLRGLLVGGLDVKTACSVWHQQPYDAAYREAHRSDVARLLPLSNPCNAYFDLVPGWVNPLLVVFTALALVSIGRITLGASRRNNYATSDPWADAVSRPSSENMPTRRSRLDPALSVILVRPARENAR